MSIVHSAHLPGAITRILLCVAVVFLAAGCATSLSVKTIRDSSIPIPAGATWGWNPVPPAERLPAELDPRADNPTVHGNVERAVETVLAAKGFRKVEPTAAEFLVNYRVGVRTTEQYQQMATGGPGSVHMTVMPTEFTQGGLLIDFLQRTTGKLAFRTWAVKDIERGAGSEKAIQDAVTQLLKDLP